jgi:hypothetical protein
MDDEGNFVVTWEKYKWVYVDIPNADQISQQDDIVARRFDKSGNALGPEFPVHSSSFPFPNPSIAMSPTGEFVIAFCDGDGRFNGSSSILVRRYNNRGELLGEDVVVSQEVPVHNYYPSVAMRPDGGFVVCWYGAPATLGNTSTILVRVFDNAGLPAGNQLAVSSVSMTISSKPTSIVVDEDGRFLITWYAPNSSGDGDVFVRGYSADGEASPYATLVSEGVHGEKPGIAITENGEAIVVYQHFEWSDDRGMTIGSIKLRRAECPGIATPPVQTTSPVVNLGIETQFKYAQSQHQTAIAPDGTYVLVWESDQRVHAQRFDAQNNRIGNELDVTQFTGYSRDISVAMNADGEFVLTWVEGDPISQSDSIYVFGTPAPPRVPLQMFAKRFDASGEARGPAIAIDEPDQFDSDPSVGIDAEGGFVVTWVRSGWGGRLPNVIDDDSHSDVFARRFDNLGVPLGGAFQVDSTNIGNQWSPAIAITPTGEFVIAFRSQSDFFHQSLLGRRFNSQGVPLGEDFSISQGEPLGCTAPSIGIRPDGGFVIGWEASYEVFGQNTVFARVFNGDGSPLGDQISVSAPISYGPISLAVDDAGRFLVTWCAPNSSGGVDVFVRGYSASGEASAYPLKVSGTYHGRQPDVAIGNNGQAIVLWHNYENSNDGPIVLRRLKFAK